MSDAITSHDHGLTPRQDFFLPSEAFDLIFLKAKIVILCTKGFEIMDLTEYVISLDQQEGLS